MIKDILNSNEEILPNTKQIEVLKENFPACFNADGSFDIERFKEYLSDKLMVSNEGYELKFLGKNYARLLASIDTTTVIVPDEEHNNKPENKDSQNIYISGDNLDGLKQLLKSYAHQVKCIYIDPPYNTGSDGFVYNDNFNFSAEELSTKLSIDEEQAQRILDLTKRGSASHSAWLMFMYPRLLLARDLLTDDGVIFISIDDNECHNLKLLCDDVFGEENFIAEFPRITKRGGKSSDIIAKNHDYFLMYSKGVKPNLYAIEHNDAAFKYSDDFFGERGFYKLNQTLDYDSLQYSSSLDYPLEIEGETFYPGQSEQLYKERQNGNHDVADWAWRWSREKFKFGCENGFIVVKHGRNGKRIYTKTYQKATIEGNDSGYYIDYSDRTKALSTLETTENIYSNDNATKDVAKTIGKKIFDHTKPLELLMLIARLCTRKGDIILDFFSGSATTAEAIMKLNCNEQDEMRKFIMIQLPELCKEGTSAYKAGYDNDLNNNLDDVVLKLFEKPGVFTDLVMRSDRDVVKSTGAEMNVIRETGVQYVIRKTIPYNVFLKRISSATNLPIKVLHTALTKYAQKHGTEFTAHINENTVAGFCAEFSAWKNDNLQGRFRYERSKAPLGATALTYADGTVRSEISQGRIGTKIVPGTPSGKYLYDSYAYDSPLEKDNIIADIDEVIVYGKIPRASIAIPTITGGMYSPDFMYVVKHKNGHKELNIIVETKDVENKTDLRGTEKAKIECAKVFFNMLTADGYTVHFRDQLGNKQMAQIISEVMRGEN